ncbi:ABC transporter thiamine pyrophosphate-binding lipoprotein p37/Cypl [Mycoplasma sp. 394]
MKFKKLFSLGILTSTASISVAVSCGTSTKADKQENQSVKLSLGTPEQYALGNLTLDQYKSKLENSLNDELKALKSNVKVEVIFRGQEDYKATFDDLTKGTSDFAFISAGYLQSNKAKVGELGFKLGIQTLTRQFNGDITYDFTTKAHGHYTDGLDDDDLRKIAKNEDTLFHAKPRSQWDDKNNGYNWDGQIYQSLYNAKTDLVPYQRGSIVLIGTDDIRSKIKQAWNSKNWNEFIKYGIVTGKNTSGGKYLLQQALLKKHFGASFKPLATVASETPDNILIGGKIKEMNNPNEAKKHIFFDDETSWAWTKYKPHDAYEINQSTRPNEKLEEFIVTEVLPYNVGVFGPYVSSDAINQVTAAFVNLYKNDKDIFGPTVGFNGYRKIDNPDVEFWPIVDNILG